MDDNDLVNQQIYNEIEAVSSPANLIDNKSTRMLEEFPELPPDERSLLNGPEGQNNIRDTDDCEILNKISFPGAEPALTTESTQPARKSRFLDQLHPDGTPSKRLRITQPGHKVGRENELLSHLPKIHGGKVKFSNKNITLTRQICPPDTDSQLTGYKMSEDRQLKDSLHTAISEAARQPQSAILTAAIGIPQSFKARQDKPMPTRVSSRVTRSQSRGLPPTLNFQNNKPNKGIKMSKLAKLQGTSMQELTSTMTHEHPHKHNPDNEIFEIRGDSSDLKNAMTKMDAREENEGSNPPSEQHDFSEGVPQTEVDGLGNVGASHRSSQNSKNNLRTSKTRTLSLHSELFGQEHQFNSLLSSAKSVGLLKRNGEGTQRVPALSTPAGKELSKVIRDARQLYKSLLTPAQPKSRDFQGSDKAQAFLNNIRKQIDELVEKDVPKCDRDLVIQDLLAHTNPHLVSLLKYAIQSRGNEYTRRDDAIYIQEIIFLMDTIECLCVKVMSWEAKPRTDAPITATTKRHIYPLIRQIKKVFVKELSQRKKAIQRRENNLLYSQSQMARQESLQRENEGRYRKREIRKARIYEDACRNAIDLFGKIRKPTIRINGRLASAELYPRTRATEQWTEEEDKELLVQLQNKEFRVLPSQERYLAILNVVLLQNKLPEHIRERALFYKAAMVRQYEEMSAQVIPEWITSIE
ncbi:MAG: hypothetical protein Q9167_006302 [Letrouitia subvulpina]